MLEGKVIGAYLPRHRHREFLRFLRLIDQETPASGRPALVRGPELDGAARGAWRAPPPKPAVGRRPGQAFATTARTSLVRIVASVPSWAHWSPKLSAPRGL